METRTDAKWAGCRRARNSTSGGARMVGPHLVKYWAKTQATIAKLSAESDLYGIVRGASETLGFMSLAPDMGTEFLARLHINARAAQRIID